MSGHFPRTVIPFHSLEESWMQSIHDYVFWFSHKESCAINKMGASSFPLHSWLIQSQPKTGCANWFLDRSLEVCLGTTKAVMVFLGHVVPDNTPTTLGQLVFVSQAFLHFQDLNSCKFSALCLAWMIYLLCPTFDLSEHVTVQLQFSNGLQLRATRLAACCLLRSEWLSGPLRQGLIIYLHALLSGPKGLCFWWCVPYFNFICGWLLFEWSIDILML